MVLDYLVRLICFILISNPPGFVELGIYGDFVRLSIFRNFHLADLAQEFPGFVGGVSGFVILSVYLLKMGGGT